MLDNNIQFDPVTEGKLKMWLERFYPEYKSRHRKDELLVIKSDCEFRVTSNYMVLTGDTDLSISRIIGGYEGQILTLEFGDSRITLKDNDSSDINTINLSDTFLGSTNDIIQLINDGISWKEISRSVN